jgi:hypothetical protein
MLSLCVAGASFVLGKAADTDLVVMSCTREGRDFVIPLGMELAGEAGEAGAAGEAGEAGAAGEAGEASVPVRLEMSCDPCPMS